MEITRTEGTNLLLKRFDFIAREISNFAARAAETRLRKNGEKRRAGNRQCHIWHSVSRYILPSGFRFPVFPSLSLPLRSHRSVPLFLLYREVVEVVCTHTGWQIGRGISFYRMRGLHARKSRKGFRKNAIFPRPGRQRMSSAHESGYPNEIQYGNVEDHLTFFTPVHCSLYLGFLLATKMQFLRITHLRIDSVRSVTWACLLRGTSRDFTKEKQNMWVQTRRILEPKVNKLITRKYSWLLPSRAVQLWSIRDPGRPSLVRRYVGGRWMWIFHDAIVKFRRELGAQISETDILNRRDNLSCAPLSQVNWYPLFVDGTANYQAPRAHWRPKGFGD